MDSKCAFLDMAKGDFAKRASIVCTDCAQLVIFSKAAGLEGIRGLLRRGHISVPEVGALIKEVEDSSLPPTMDAASGYITPNDPERVWGDLDEGATTRVLNMNVNQALAAQFSDDPPAPTFH